MWEKLKFQMEMVERFNFSRGEVFKKLGHAQNKKWGRLKFQMKMVEIF
jgi:hypothetical protein